MDDGGGYGREQERGAENVGGGCIERDKKGREGEGRGKGQRRMAGNM